MNQLNLELDFFKSLFEKVLKEFEEERERNLNILRPDFSQTEKHSDELDDAVQDIEEGMLVRLLGRKGHYIRKVKLALEKIDTGVFGECECCGQPIERNRLYARPVASLCLKCKEEEERDEQKILYHKRSHSLGKELISDAETDELSNHIEHLCE